MDENMSNNELVMLYYDFLVGIKNKFGMNDDCFQMAVIDILEYDNDKLNEMHSKDQLKYWFVRLFKNYWFSKTSRYYTTYEKYYQIHTELPED